MPPKVKTEQSNADIDSDTGAGSTSGNDISLNASLGIAPNNTSSTSSGSTDFVKKLFLMLEDNAYETVVTWTKSGDSFVVLDTNEFTKEILPKHFKHSNFASFVRQLNKYDFHKVKQSSEERQKSEYGDAAWEFKHPDFRRHDRDALETIKRKGPAQKRSATDESHDSLSKMEENYQNLRKDYSQLQDEVKSLNQRYTNVIESIITMKSINDRYFRSINTLVSALANNGIKLPQLDLPSLEPPLGAGSRPLQQQPQQQQQQSQQPQTQQQQLALGNTGKHHKSISINTHQSTPSQGSNQSLSSIPIPPQQLHQQQQQQQPPPPPPQTINSQQPPPPQTRPGQQELSANFPIKPDHKYHVLLVEDDNVCIQLCTKFLEKIGCSVEVVSDGLTAISALEKGRYDIVFMDIIMPNLDGATATSIVRSFDNLTPIIAMTGNIEGSDLVTYLQHGMSDILAKPFTKDDLYQMLHKHLNSRTPLIYHQTDDHIDKRQKI